MADPNASERMRQYWAEKKAREEKKDEKPPVEEVVLMDKPVDYGPPPDVSEQERWLEIMALIKNAPHDGAKEAIIDQHRSFILRGMMAGWGET